MTLTVTRVSLQSLLFRFRFSTFSSMPLPGTLYQATDSQAAPNSPTSPFVQSPIRPIFTANSTSAVKRRYTGSELVKPIIEITSQIEALKQYAAWTAVDKHVLPHHKVIGIGSGSTVPYVVERIVAQGPIVNKDRVFIPTGFQSKELIVAANLRLGDVDQYPIIDVTVDGADEVDQYLNCIKGGGGCHLREKVLAEAADTFIIVADSRKDSLVLGTNWKGGVPIEVAPFAYAKVLHNLALLGSPKPILRMAKAKAGPVVSDNGNFIIDAPFNEEHMKDPYTLLTRIKMLTGVVEVGLFCHMVKAAYFGNQDGSVTVRWVDGKTEHITKESGSGLSNEVFLDDD